jgi:catechol 2,3-dioxygenase
MHHAADTEPILDVAQLAHVELLTPDLDASVAFFTELLGLIETERAGPSVFLRGAMERSHHSLKLTAAARPGLGHVAWRSRSPAALARRVAALEAVGFGLGWVEGDAGHGRAFRFATPEGHAMELFWDLRYAPAVTGRASVLPSRRERRPGRGVPVDRIDHLNLMTIDTAACRDFLVDVLGFRERDRIEADGGRLVMSHLAVTNLSHDIALVPEPAGAQGRLHHVCFYCPSVQHLFDLADLAREAGIVPEWGPGRHGIGGTSFLYLLEPGGNRIEVIGDCGTLAFDPSAPVTVWQLSDFDIAAAWIGSGVPPSFMKYGTPPAETTGSTVAA